MTGLSSDTLEIIGLVLAIINLVLGFLYHRKKKELFNWLRLGVGYLETQTMIERAKAQAREGKKIGF